MSTLEIIEVVRKVQVVEIAVPQGSPTLEIAETGKTDVIEILGFVGQGPEGPVGPLGPAGRSGSPRVVTLAYANPLPIDWSVADIVRVTLAGDTTIVMSGANDGQKCALELAQDGVGGRHPVWGSEVSYGTDLPSITLSALASKRDKLGFIFDAVTGKFDFVAILRGF